MAEWGAKGNKSSSKKRSAPLSETIYHEIKRRILENEYPPGFQALEMSLAADFNASRTPVREALLRLEKERLVEIIPRHGMRVLPMAADDMLEIYQVMTKLESLVVELIATRKPDDVELRPLQEATRRMRQALDADDLDAWPDADDRFHRTMLEMAGNKRLAAIVNGFWDQTHRAQRVTIRLRKKPERSTANHIRLIEAFRRGDTSLARKIHEAQRRTSHAELIDILARYHLRHF
jgi:DNA-binding GntR family transcriptional regulator